MRVFLLLLAALLSLLLGAGFFLPKQVEVEREIIIQRPAATVYTVLNGFRSFTRWSPMVSGDPGVHFSRSGPDFGQGARIEWSGDPRRIGTGWQEVESSTPYTLINYRMHSGPQGDANARIVIRGDPLASSVRWAFSSDVTRGQGFFSGWLGRYFGVFLQRWVATELETDLLALKAYAETLPAADFSRAEISRLDAPAITVAMVEFVADQESGTLAQPLSGAFEAISGWALATGARLGGQPMVITHASRDGQGRFAAAIPLLDGPRFAAPDASPVRVGEAPQGDAVRVVHRGPYAESWRSREQLDAWVAAHGYRAGTTSWEHYLTDPAGTAAGDLVTHIYLLLEPDSSRADKVAAKRLLQGPGSDGWLTRSLSPARN